MPSLLEGVPNPLKDHKSEALANGVIDPNKMLSPIKPVNLLPEVPSQTSRKLSDREQHDCEVIGSYSSNSS